MLPTTPTVTAWSGFCLFNPKTTSIHMGSFCGECISLLLPSLPSLHLRRKKNRYKERRRKSFFVSTSHVPGMHRQFTYLRGRRGKDFLCARHCPSTVPLSAGVIRTPTQRGRRCYWPTVQMRNGTLKGRKGKSWDSGHTACARSLPCITLFVFSGYLTGMTWLIC